MYSKKVGKFNATKNDGIQDATITYNWSVCFYGLTIEDLDELIHAAQSLKTHMQREESTPVDR